MTTVSGLLDCPVCATRTERRFLLRRSPLLQNVLYDDRAAAVAAETGDCPIHYCPDCHIAFNPEFAAERIHYDLRYDNDQSSSATYRLYLDELASTLITDCHLTPQSTVLEIGCGNGYLLARMRELGQVRALGYDPAWSGRFGSEEFIRRELFTPPPGYRADLVILRHCFEALTDPVALLRSIATVLNRSSRIYIESANLDYILHSADFSLLSHEYAVYFSVGGLARYLARHGLSLVTSSMLFDEQYFGCLFRPTPGWDRLQRAPEQLRRALSECSPTMLWGTSGRTITMLSHLGLDEDIVAACVDISPSKQGRHVPGTGQRIISAEEARAARPRRVVAANHNYVAEIAAELPPDTELLSTNDIIDRGTHGSE
jgi:SAM-dependent methyltransferase